MSLQVSLLLAMPEGNHDPSNAALRFLTMEVEDVTSQVNNRGVGRGGPREEGRKVGEGVRE